MIETEAKIRLNDLNLGKVIEKLGEPLFFEQINAFYRLNGKLVRLRKEKDDFYLTIKENRIASRFNKRIEHEIKISSMDCERIVWLLEKTAKKDIVFLKRRANFMFSNCIVSLDCIENINFLEIEGKDKDIEKAIVLLGLEKHENENRSYYEILKEGENGLYRKNI